MVDDRVSPKINRLLEKIQNGEKIVPASSIPHVDREASLKRYGTRIMYISMLVRTLCFKFYTTIAFNRRAMMKHVKSKGKQQEKRKLSTLLDEDESDDDDDNIEGPEAEGGRTWVSNIHLSCL